MCVKTNVYAGCVLRRIKIGTILRFKICTSAKCLHCNIIWIDYVMELDEKLEFLS